jgi:hypothetical protein
MEENCHYGRVRVGIGDCCACRSYLVGDASPDRMNTRKMIASMTVQLGMAMIEKGYLGIRTVVDSAIFIIAVDTTINGYFQLLLGEVGSGNLSGYQRLSLNLSNFVAVATGGPRIIPIPVLACNARTIRPTIPG